MYISGNHGHCSEGYWLVCITDACTICQSGHWFISEITKQFFQSNLRHLWKIFWAVKAVILDSCWVFFLAIKDVYYKQLLKFSRAVKGTYISERWKFSKQLTGSEMMRKSFVRQGIQNWHESAELKAFLQAHWPLEALLAHHYGNRSISEIGSACWWDVR